MREICCTGPQNRRNGRLKVTASQTLLPLIEAFESRLLFAIPWEGPSLSLDGTNDFAQILSNNTLALGTSGADFTLEAIIYIPNAVDAPPQTIIWKDGAYALLIDRSSSASDQISLRVYRTGTIFNALIATGDLSTGWHHVAGVFDNEFNSLSDQLRVYLDGTRIAFLDVAKAGQINPDANASTNPLNIGAKAGADAFGGWIDEVRLSSTSRYTSTTYSIPSIPFESDSSTRALWHFSDAPGASNFADASGRGNTLSAQNGATTAVGPGTTPPVVQDIFNIAPDPRKTPVAAVDVVWSERIDVTTFMFDDVTLTRDGVAVPLNSSVIATHLSGTTYRLWGLDAFTNVQGVYVLSVAGSGIADLFGTSGSGSASDTWLTDLTGPTLLTLSNLQPDPNLAPVSSVDLTFDEPISIPSFSHSDITLSRGGTPVTLNTSVGLTQLSPAAHYRIAGLEGFTREVGLYSLCISGNGLTDEVGNAGTGSLCTSWQRQPPGGVQVSSAEFLVATGHRIRFAFNADVRASLIRDDLQVFNESTSAAVPSTAFTLAVSGAAFQPTEAEWTAILPLTDGNYRATLPAGSVDASGIPLNSESTFYFFVLAGDLNRDRTVSIADFITLASNFNKTDATYADGDLNHDGTVSIADFIDLAASFNKTISSPNPPVQPTAGVGFAANTDATREELLQTDSFATGKKKPRKVLGELRPRHHVLRLRRYD